MSTMILKAAANFLKVEPEEIMQNFEKIMNNAKEGVELLSSIDNRIRAIESHLGIEREENGETDNTEES